MGIDVWHGISAISMDVYNGSVYHILYNNIYILYIYMISLGLGNLEVHEILLKHLSSLACVSYMLVV